jgi:autotransporter passenger strand-loop-strand repeat protein
LTSTTAAFVSGLRTISSGGQAAVSSGGKASGILVSSGGTLDVASPGGREPAPDVIGPMNRPEGQFTPRQRTTLDHRA